MKIPDGKLEEISQRLDILDVVGQYLTLTRKGANYWGLCPFHNEKTPSFSVAPEKSMFYCFGCHKGGSMFTFVMELEKVPFLEAVKMLAEKAGVTIDTGESEAVTTERDALYELLDRVAGSFHHILMKTEAGKPVREYLERRSIRDDMIELFRLGYSPEDREWLYGFLREKKYSDDFLRKTGLFSAKYPKKSFFSNRLMFPIVSHRGKTIGFGGRILTDGEPKYLNSSESGIFRKGENLYGFFQAVQSIRKEKSFNLVEGYVDVLAMHQAGITNTIAPLGTALTEHQARFLKRNADTAVLLFDSDEAGRKATRRAIEICERAGLSSFVVEIPGEKDPADILRKQGTEALKNILKYRINSFDFLLKQAMSGCNPETPEGKEFVINQLFSYIECIDSEVKREGYTELIAQALDVDRRSVARDFSRETKRPVPKQEITRVPSGAGGSVDLFLMIAVTMNRDKFGFVRTVLTAEDLEDGRARDIFIGLEESFRNEEESVELLLSRIEREDVKALILEKATTGEFSINSDRIIKDAVYRIRQRSIRKKRAQIESKLRKAGTGKPGMNEIKELLAEKMYLDGELEKLKVNLNDRYTD